MEKRICRERLLTFLAIILIISAYVVNAQLTNTVTIQNTGQISASTVWAKSGTVEDIQAAVDAVMAAGGGIVYVPEGDFLFDINGSKTYHGLPVGVIVQGGVSIIGAGKGKTILRQTRSDINLACFFYCDGLNGKPIRISGLTLVGNVTDENIKNRGIRMLRAKDFRIDNCEFIDFSSAGIIVTNHREPYGVNRGVIDHCDFDNPYKDDPNVIGAGSGGRKIWGYGVQVVGTYYNWEENITNLLGKYDELSNIVYIEDCTFKRWRHAIASNGGAFYVVRNCTFYEPRPEHYHMVDVHGTSGDAPAVGGRGLEAYNNTFYGCEYKWQDPSPPYSWHSMAFGIRGGGGVIFNNTIIDCKTGILLASDPGQQEKCRVRDMWIWNNIMLRQNMTTNMVYISNTGGYEENVDYFLYQKPNYTPYPYPHPLTLERLEYPVNITGTVTDSETSLPIQGAMVSCKAYSSTTNSTGRYMIRMPSTGYCNLTASKAGYISSFTFLNYSVNGTYYFNFSLKRIPINITERIADKNGTPVRANISLYRGTNISYTTSTDSEGRFSLSITPAVYDILYSMPNFWLRLNSVNISSNVYNKLTHVTLHASRVSLIFNITKNQTFQFYSEDKPKVILKNNTALQEHRSIENITANYGWYYSPTEETVYVNFNESI